MSDDYGNESLLDMFIFEATQLLEQLENSILHSEKEKCFSEKAINEIFRIMHTIKGSAAMMSFDNISMLAHSMEDIFYYLREENPKSIDYMSLYDLVFCGVDFFQTEIAKIKNGIDMDGTPKELINSLEIFLMDLKQKNGANEDTNRIISESLIDHKYENFDSETMNTDSNIFKAVIYFQDGCEMENIRAFNILYNLKQLSKEFFSLPRDIIDSVETIRKDGFTIYLKSNHTYSQIYDFFMQTIFLKHMELKQLEDENEFQLLLAQNSASCKEDASKLPDSFDTGQKEKGSVDKEIKAVMGTQSIISVNVSKLDKLMDLVGEMVIAEAMVTQNQDLAGLVLNNFKKSAIQLNKITSELQDIVMSIRMVSLSASFNKMNRIVRDMCRKLKKDVNLDIIGEETEVDKNIIEHISDPLMHLVRNSVDHGIEPSQERLLNGKPSTGTITLEAKNSGSDVLISVKDDGSGLDKERILKKAREQGLLIKREQEMSDKEIYNLILLPGFSTNESVTEYSGRGVGLDVVTKNIEAIGGVLSVESAMGKGTIFTIKIPLTLAIIDGINIKVGNAHYTIPTISIKEFFRPKEEDVITDSEGNEMIMVRGQCYKIVRLSELYHVRTKVTNFTGGIMLMVEQSEKTICVFADELLGQQQIVVKALPDYITRFKKIQGLAGCTLLGDGNISLILDVDGIIDM